jgi:hypothetical protein
MPYSNRRPAFGRRSGTVTVIEEPVRRNAARTAKIAACVTALTVTLLAATVLASYLHPILALFAGLLIGVVTAFLVAVTVLAWPVLRVLWWWSVEITAAFGLVTGWVEMADHTSMVYRIGVVAVIIGVPAAIPWTRRWVIATAWCVITRHRLRSCFSEFIITNRYGSLPLILWTRPTPVGERVWIWLRPGLALGDIQDRLDLLAVACWAASVTAEAASDTNSARIRLDIKRRDALTATVGSPLLGLVPPAPESPVRDAVPVPSALDLPDVAATDVTPAKTSPRSPKAPAAVPALKPAPEPGLGDDIKDWI